MKKILFAKFSRERREHFQISTVISEENGRKQVEKTPLLPMAETHLSQMQRNSERLKTLYADPSIQICPCELTKQGTAVFPFIQGKSLEQIITDHIEQGNFEKVREDVTRLYQILLSTQGLAPFEASRSFVQMFGTPVLPGEQQAAPISNLDMLFANILVNETGYWLVDYEWVFDFMIPISYIFFRSLMLHGKVQMLPREQINELYAIGGILPEDILVYYQMEVNFQQYASGDDEIHVLTKLYPKMKTHCYFLDYWNTKHVYYEVKLLGIPEKQPEASEELFCKHYILDDTEAEVVIPDTKKYQSFLFQPVDTECVVKLHCLEGIKADGSVETVAFTHNAQVNLDDEYYFQQVPFFAFENNGYERLTFSYKIWHRNDFLIKQGIDFRMQIADLNQELRKYTERLDNRILRKAGKLLKRS